VLVFVCGGTGGLHATALHSFGTSLAQTRPIASPISTAEAHAAQ
jgi:hypothetical protein